MNDRQRWDRLASVLSVLEITDANVSDFRDSHRICIRRADGVHVVIHDTWRRRNPDLWTGWEVYTEDTEGFMLKTWPRSKKYGETLAAVREATA